MVFLLSLEMEQFLHRNLEAQLITKKTPMSIIFLSLVILLTGCSLTPTPQLTSTPQLTPTEEEELVIIPELNGTFWSLNSLDGSDPIPGTQINLLFIDGWVTGNSGCNDYGGEYTATDEGGIAIHFIISHQDLCMEPIGVMDQEAFYLSIIDDVNQYGIVDGQLKLSSGDDNFLLFGYLQVTE